VSFCLAIPSWTWPSPTVLACFGIVALLSVGIHVAIANGYRSGALASLVPFDFLRLIFVLLLEFIVLGLDVPILAWVGSAIVLLALVLNTLLDHRHAALRRVGAAAGKSTPPIGP
jgi:drug/metabolite transporter (DMT)-like permease